MRNTSSTRTGSSACKPACGRRSPTRSRWGSGPTRWTRTRRWCGSSPTSCWRRRRCRTRGSRRWWTGSARKGAIDLVGAVGYYSLVSMILNVDRVQLPPGEGAAAGTSRHPLMPGTRRPGKRLPPGTAGGQTTPHSTGTLRHERQTAPLGFPDAARRLGVPVRVLRRAIRSGKVAAPPHLTATTPLSAEWVESTKAALEASPGADAQDAAAEGAALRALRGHVRLAEIRQPGA